MGPVRPLFEALESAVSLGVLRDWDCCLLVPLLWPSLSQLGASSTSDELQLLEVGAAKSPRPPRRHLRQPWFVKRKRARGVFEGLEKGRDLVGAVVSVFACSGTAIEPRMGIWEANGVVLMVLCPRLAV